MQGVVFSAVYKMVLILFLMFWSMFWFRLLIFYKAILPHLLWLQT